MISVFWFGLVLSFPAEQFAIVCTYHTFLIHSSVTGHLGCFRFLVVVTRASVNMAEQGSVQYAESFGHVPRSAVAGSYGRFVFIFLGSLHSGFHRARSSVQPISS